MAMVGKVSGPGGGPPIGGAPGDEGGNAPAVGGSRFADALDATKPAADPNATAAPGNLTADVAADLRAGRIDAKVAVERVIDRVLDKQLGPDAPAPVREKLRAALETALADDPLLSEKLKSLSSG
jgi:hypothetical protein